MSIIKNQGIIILFYCYIYVFVKIFYKFVKKFQYAYYVQKMRVKTHTKQNFCQPVCVKKLYKIKNININRYKKTKKNTTTHNIFDELHGAKLTKQNPILSTTNQA